MAHEKCVGLGASLAGTAATMIRAVRGVVLAATVVAAAAFGQDDYDVEPAESPQQAVQRLHEALVDMAAQHGDEPIDERYRYLLPVVRATHDLPYIAELSIRRQWSELTEDERQRFLAAFERLSVTTYASRFRSLQPGMFSVGGSESTAGGRAEVTATLTTPDGDAIPFQYVLHEVGDGWKIVNILADNVSDLALKRAEYRRLLQTGSIDELIADLESQATNAD